MSHPIKAGEISNSQAVRGIEPTFMEPPDQSYSNLLQSLYALQLGNSKAVENVFNILDEKFDVCATSYQNLSSNFPTLLSMLEKFEPPKVHKILCVYLFDQIKGEDIVRRPNKLAIRTEAERADFANQANITIMKLMQESIENGHRLFDSKTKPNIGNGDRELWANYLSSVIDASFDEVNPTDLHREISIFYLDLYYEISKDTDFSETFYFRSSTIIQKLIYSNDFNRARTLNDTILALSFKRDHQDLAFHLAAAVDLARGNILEGLLNMCISIKRIRVKKEVSEKIYFHVHLDSLRLFGFSGSPYMVSQMFSLIKSRFTLSDLEDVSLYYHYFFIKMQFESIDDQTIKEIHDYIISKVVIFTQPSLGNQYANLVLALKINFQQSAHSSSLDSLLLRFKDSLGERAYKNHENNYVASDLDALINPFQLLDIRLKGNIDRSEIESILRQYEGHISILHKASVEKGEINGYLVSMIFKSDYALSVEQLKWNNNLQNQTDFKNYKHHIQSNLDVGSSELLYLSTDHNKLFALHYHQRQFWSIKTINNWTYADFESWQIILHDYLIEKRKFRNIKHSLTVFSGIEVEKITEAGEILLVKDVWISNFPHNLLRDNQGGYLILKRPIVDVISAEWLMNLSNNKINHLSIEAYVPIADNDRVIKEVVFENDRFQKLIDKYKIKVETSLLPSRPINGIINIIVAHGRVDIKDFFSLNTGSHAILNIDAIVGEGKIAILFVCNAGSQKMSDYRHKVASLVRLFLLKKYQTVIAPAWDLDATVVSPWLQAFLQKFESGASVSDAFHVATNKIHTMNENPMLWACLHIYGNPHLSLTR